MTTRYRLERQVTAAHFGHSWYFGVVCRRADGRVRQAPGLRGRSGGRTASSAPEGAEMEVVEMRRRRAQQKGELWRKRTGRRVAASRAAVESCHSMKRLERSANGGSVGRSVGRQGG